MKRFWFLVVLMVLSSSADAGNSLSFVVGGHRIRIEAPRHCHSTVMRLGIDPRHLSKRAAGATAMTTSAMSPRR